ncbi:MAG: hypothetical protein FWC10_02330 [Lentimicrobiaceae bacterium]|nr:hypothetical protein [Lentimicrobiaceae bacterium]
MNKKLFFVLVPFISISLWAQDVPLGQFKEYLAYNRFHSVAQDHENIYAATDKSILVVDKSGGAQDKWSNLNGLSDVGIQTIHSDNEGRLFIAYTNSNIDIVKDYKVYNIRDLLNKQITGSKTINSIFTFGGLAYFSCDFGVVIIDLDNLLVKDTWFTIKHNEPYRAHSLAIHNDRYYLATDKGVCSLPVNTSNPADFSSWTQEEELPQVPYKLLFSYQDKLFAVQNTKAIVDTFVFDTLFVYQNSHWNYDASMEIEINSFDKKDEKLLICSWNHIQFFSGDNFIDKTYWKRPPHRWQSGRKAIFDDKMNVWIADDNLGLIYLDLQNDTSIANIAEGPANSSSYGLCFLEGMLAVVPGARSGAIVPSWNAPAISILQNDKWWSTTDFSQLNADAPESRPGGFNSVAINPKNTNEIYIGSWLDGLYKINRETHEIFCYNNYNSPLKSTRVKDSIVFVSGLTIDKQNHLWMAHTDAANDPIKVKDLNTTEDKWYTIDLSSYIPAKSYVEHILIDSRNYKWITAPVANTLIVFYENGSLENDALHKKTTVNLTSEAKVAGTRLTCIAEDREGRIWVGADQGIKVIYDAASVFNRQVYAKNILLEQFEYIQILLEYEYITCIAVDAADRKWIGTRSAGVFLISPSGTQELFHFTTENSPLFSNQIYDIKINPENGEVFIATDGGLISYKGTATMAKDNYKEALVYPNPVREDYYGPVAVKGLMEDSFCKITDTKGNLVWQGYAYGGQLIWNGKDFYGNRPATGVYFVMASSKTGKEKKVAKFLFVK